MKLILGSTSTDKKRIIREALADKYTKLFIDGVSADSGVSDQPLTIQETKNGAKNRAMAAWSTGKFDLAAGIEGGLQEIDGIYSLIGIVAFYDGSNYFLGQSDLLALPEVVSRKVMEGEQFGEVIRDYEQAIANSTESERLVVAELVSRQMTFTTAAHRALIQMG